MPFSPMSESTVRELLSAIASGEQPVKVLDGTLTWDEVSADGGGYVTFVAGSYAMSVFNDCGKLDYVGWVVRGGKRWTYSGKRSDVLPQRCDHLHFVLEDKFRSAR